MKRTLMTGVVIGVLMASGVGSYRVQSSNESIDNAVQDIKVQATEEFKKAFSNEVSAFFKNNDLSQTLGLDSEGQTKLEESIKTYINQYSMDEEKLNEARDSLSEFFQDAKGLSAEEIQDRIKGIFEK